MHNVRISLAKRINGQKATAHIWLETQGHNENPEANEPQGNRQASNDPSPVNTIRKRSPQLCSHKHTNRQGNGPPNAMRKCACHDMHHGSR